jgi:L-methionine (R)-S-oxide reductase
MAKVDKWEDWLERYLARHQATSGTVHVVQDGSLRLVAAFNIPAPVQQIVAWVPNGKGMAGLALQRKQPVQTCNLQEDRSGSVRPGAKAVNAKAAVALPIMGTGGEVRAVVGLAFQHELEFDDAHLRTLSDTAATLPD